MEPKHNKKLVPIAKILRRNMTKEERHLWYDFLKDYPVKFLRQKPIRNYVVDFYCATANLVIEIDGSQHFYTNSLKRDEERTQILNSYGINVLRVSNSDIHRNFRGVCETIDDAVKQSLNKII